ncbi:MAG TPA: endopeptidase La [Longimicrobiales bacterium]
MSERLTLPVLPLRETVIFPGVAVPINAGRPGTVEAIQKALETNRDLFAVCQRENVDDVKPEVLHQVGTIVRVLQVQRTRTGVQLLIQGHARAFALSYSPAGEAMLEAIVRPLAEHPPLDPKNEAFIALDRELRERAAELGHRRGVPQEALTQFVEGVEPPGAFADLVAFYLDIPAQDKQALLELTEIEERMRKVLVAVERELLRLETQEQIQQKVQEELGEKQREMVLREQMKQIQKELGEDEQATEIEELKQRAAALELPEEARKEVDREIHRLERTHPQSAEYQVIRSYLEWVLELPWNTRTEDRIDLAQAQQVLEEDHYGLEDVKDRILEFLAVRKLQMERAASAAKAGASPETAPAGEGAGAGAEAASTEASAEVAPSAESAQATSSGEGPEAATSSESPEAASSAESPEAATSSEGAEAAATGESPEAAASGEGAEAAASEESAQAEPDEASEQGDAARARAVGRGPILLFVGPPGVGKTSIAKSIARALGRKYVRIALGGARDEADIRGHRRTYVGALPGRIIQGLRQAGTKNPVFLLDEVDKLGVSLQGDPAAALLEVLDPAQNHAFVDHYLGIPFDLSEALFIATANWRDQIPAPLLDRMEMVEFSGYTEQEKLEIAKRYLLPRQREESGLSPEQLEVTDAAIQRVISEYTREAGVRQLERELGRLARKAARKIAAGEATRMVIDEADVQPLIGRPRVRPERALHEDAVGVATGMYYTPMGGDIMFVEASVSSGKDALILTGQLGDVMKESARAALTYARTHHDELGIPEERLKDVEIHIHVPAGAVPKDGPSAGVTMATALVSALSGRPARFDVAMTGEITLTGRVLPIGGVKEKVLGAYRAGIRQVILPQENESDLEDLPEEVRSEMQFHLVSSLREVLALALRGASLHEGSLIFPEPGIPAPAGRFPPSGPLLNREA